MSVIIFLVILLVLILVHEFGHFIVAKKNGIRVDEFGIGFPPRALTFAEKNGTKYTLNWLPFGGFVKIFGESPTKDALSGPDASMSFVNKSKFVQAAVLVAGVVFNLVFAWLLFVIIFMAGVTASIPEEDIRYASNLEIVIIDTLIDSPAARAGVLEEDTIISLGGEPVVPRNGIDQIIDYISTQGEKPVTLTLLRDGEERTLIIFPETGLISDNPERVAIGIAMVLSGKIQYPIHLAVWEGAKLTYHMTKTVAVAIFGLLASAFTLSADLSDVAGPIGIVGIVGEAAEFGIVSLLFFTAIISINLAVINILPIPALDGGRLLFLLIETIKGSPIRPSIVNTLHGLFFVLLILLILLISYNDILRITAG